MAQDGGKFVSLTHRPHLHPGNTPGTHFCQGLITGINTFKIKLNKGADKL
jgi:hypothetical protein